jgi:uncharacterized damage-inducible protein DinB
MTESQDGAAGAGRAFIERSRRYLAEDYLSRIRTALVHLPVRDLWWRPNPESNSVGNLLLHLAGNARQWIVAGVGGQADHREREGEFSADGGLDAPEVLRRLEAVVQEVDDVLRALSPDALSERRVIQGRNVTVLDAIYHVVEHFSMHVCWRPSSPPRTPTGTASRASSRRSPST